MTTLPMHNRYRATVTTLKVDDDVTMDENVTAPSTLTLEILPGNTITLGDYNLVINGPFREQQVVSVSPALGCFFWS